ncbi:MAG: hypothetical protein WA126_15040 [Thermodesulfovibrionales bacterium]
MRKQTIVVGTRTSQEKYERLKQMVAEQCISVGSFLRILVNDFLRSNTRISFS